MWQPWNEFFVSHRLKVKMDINQGSTGHWYINSERLNIHETSNMAYTKLRNSIRYQSLHLPPKFNFLNYLCSIHRFIAVSREWYRIVIEFYLHNVHASRHNFSSCSTCCEPSRLLVLFFVLRVHGVKNSIASFVLTKRRYIKVRTILFARYRKRYRT